MISSSFFDGGDKNFKIQVIMMLDLFARGFYLRDRHSANDLWKS